MKIIRNLGLEATLNNRRIYMNKLIVDDIKRKSLPFTPLKEGELRNKITTSSNSFNGGKIVWEMPYASYQERGKRKDGTHIIRKYTTPGTGSGFAKDSVNKTFKNLNEYFIKSIKSIK